MSFLPLSTSHPNFIHFDPADRIIAATAIKHNMALVSCDKKLKKVSTITVVW
jgi:PIN domain nuclease of toxin-antitoxin system